MFKVECIEGNEIIVVAECSSAHWAWMTARGLAKDTPGKKFKANGAGNTYNILLWDETKQEFVSEIGRTKEL